MQASSIILKPAPSGRMGDWVMHGLLVSIIVPVYNAEKHLKNCIQSVLVCPSDQYELILVDDGSTDGSGNICSSYEDNSKVKIIHQKNAGVSAARNTGIEAASGRYIFFLDADDTITQGGMDEILSVAAEDAYDFAAFSYCSVTEEGRKFPEPFSFQQKVCTDSREIYRVLFGTPLLCTCWGKLFRAECIRKQALKFDDSIAVGEDYIFVMQFVSKASSDRLILINVPVINYLQNNNGAMRTINLAKYSRGLGAVWKEGMSILQEGLLREFQEDFVESQFKTIMYYLRLISHEPRKKALRDLTDFRENGFVQEIIAKAEGTDLSGRRKLEIRMVKQKSTILYDYLKLKQWLRGVLRQNG